MKSPKEEQPLDKSIKLIRMQKTALKQAMLKKYQKPLTDKIFKLFEAQYNRIGQMSIDGYFELLQAVFF